MAGGAGAPRWGDTGNEESRVPPAFFLSRFQPAAVLKANQLPVPKDPAAFEMLKEFNLKLEPSI